MRHYQRFALSIFVLIVCSCARVVNPSGGDKDITPPVLEKSIPANKSTNFTGTTLILGFDEYVSLDNPAQNIIVAPLPKNKVKYKLKGRDIYVEFDETLLPNTTYSLFFGDAIKDVNEGNVLSNFSFVFSTGNQLDSLEISGTVKFAHSDLPAEKIKVLAHENLADSAVLTSKPIYVSATDAQGNYTFKNLPNKSFRIFALDDKNGNLIKDLPNESFGFTEDKISALDSGAVAKPLRIFETEVDLKRKKHSFFTHNILAISFNKNAPIQNKQFFTLDGSSINVLAGESESDSILLHLVDPIPDTIINPFTKDSIAVSFSDRNKDFPSSWELNGNKVIWDSVFITSPLPLAPTDSFAVCGLKDSLEFCVDFKSGAEQINQRKIRILSSFTDSMVLGQKMWLKAGSVQCLEPFKTSTNDSLYFSLQKPDSSTFGVLSVRVNNIDGLKGFFVLKQDQNTIIQLPLAGEKEYLFESPLLSAGAYTLLFVKDDNEDGKWSPGEFSEERKAQAERTVAFKETIKIRSNWELDLEWDLSLTEE